MVKQLSTIVFSILLLITSVGAQSTSGLTAMKEKVLSEAQRILMTEIYQVSPDKVDELIIINAIEGMGAEDNTLFCFSSYKYNDTRGAVIVMYDRLQFEKGDYKITSLHLPANKVVELNSLFQNLEAAGTVDNNHKIQRFNERIVLDVTHVPSGVLYGIWMDGILLSKMAREKWIKGYKVFSEG